MLSRRELRQLAKDLLILEKRIGIDGPRDDDELHAWIVENLGIDIPRTSVCKDHNSPFQFLADCYFERLTGAVAVANRGGSKCVDGDTLLVDQNTGRRIKISDAVKDQSFNSIATLSSDMKLEVSTPAAKVHTGKKQCFRFTLSTGRTITVTPEHPFLTLEGWKRADEIDLNQSVALPAFIPDPISPIKIPDNHIDLLAVLLSEGSYTQSNVGFSTTDEKILEIINKSIPNDVSIKKCSGDNVDYRISKKIFNSRKINPVRKMMDDYGLLNEKALVKRIPECIFTANNKQIARFLSIFFMCDGYVPKDKAPKITLASKGLVEDIQHLLLRLGIQSGIRFYKANYGNGKQFDCWKLSVFSAKDFKKKIKLWGDKEKRLNEVCSLVSNYNIGRPYLNDNFIKKIKKQIDKQSWHEQRKNAPLVRKFLGWGDKMPTGSYVLKHGSVKTLSRKRLQALCDYRGVDTEDLKHLLSEDLWWDNVINIEDVGEREVYDISMTPSECFVANDIIVHNTYLVSLLHCLNSKFKTGIESATIGAIEMQAKRAYQHVDAILSISGREDIDRATVTDIRWKNGSRLEVLPGCLPSGARIITKDGPERIDRIVSKRLPVEVKSYNFNKKCWEWKKVIDWFNNGKTDTWLSMKLDINAQGISQLTATPGHQVLRPDGSKDDFINFKPGDEVLVPGEWLSEEQEQVMIGSMLGDGSVSKHGAFRVHHCDAQLNYLQWKGDVFSEFSPCFSRREARFTHGVDFRVIRRTRAIRSNWYSTGKKRVPDWVWDKLDVLGLAVLVMDDGCWIRSGNGGMWAINALNFNSKERDGLSRTMSRFGIDGKWNCISKEKDQYVWHTDVDSGIALQVLISDYIDISVKQSKGYKRWIAKSIKEHSSEVARTATIVDIWQVNRENRRYDITVEDNHNYCTATGVLISNTKNSVNGPHPQVVHFDEVELADPEVFDESRNMALLLDANIPTPSGYRLLDSLEVGEKVIGLDGDPISITGTSEVFKDKDTYKFVLSDKREIISCIDHLWKVANGYKRSIDSWSLMTTKEIVDYYENKKNNKSHSHVLYLPKTPIVQYSNTVENFYIHPYVLGCLLGDGSFRESVQLTSTKQELVSKFESLLPKDCCLSGKAPRYIISGGRCGSNKNRFNKEIEDLELLGKLSHAKFIPLPYKFASYENRLEMLRGLMDTDGNKPRVGESGVSFTSRSEQLVDDVCELVRGLGGKASKSSKYMKSEWSEGILFCVYFVMPKGARPFHYKEKFKGYSESPRTLCSSITSVEYHGKEDVKCITVDAKDGMFLAEDFIPTHNSVSKKTKTRLIQAQDIITSTRKRANGPMQKLVDEIQVAESAGLEPPYKLFSWCIFETSAPAQNCQVSNPDLPDDQKCNCHRITKGVWDDGGIRTLKDVCGGKFAKSQGWVPFSDVVKTFTKTSRDVWEAQQECIKPNTSNIILKNFKRAIHGIRKWRPDPELGKIYEGIDFGGGAPHAVIFIQVVDYDIDYLSSRGDKIRIPKGSFILFDEIYMANIGNARLAELIAEREAKWRKRYPDFKVYARFSDPQGRAARLDLARAKIPIKTIWVATTRKVEQHIPIVNELIDDRMLFVDIEKCPMWTEQAEVWAYKKKPIGMLDAPDEPVKDFDHSLDASRYAIVNIVALKDKDLKDRISSLPASREHNSISSPISNNNSNGAWLKRFASPGYIR